MIILIFVLWHLHQHLNHVLHTLADSTSTEHYTEVLTNPYVCLVQFLVREVSISHVNFDRIVSALLKQQKKNLSSCTTT